MQQQALAAQQHRAPGGYPGMPFVHGGGMPFGGAMVPPFAPQPPLPQQPHQRGGQQNMRRQHSGKQRGGGGGQQGQADFQHQQHAAQQWMGAYPPPHLAAPAQFMQQRGFYPNAAAAAGMGGYPPYFPNPAQFAQPPLPPHQQLQSPPSRANSTSTSASADAPHPPPQQQMRKALSTRERVCNYWREGRCRHMDNPDSCPFLHHEIDAPPVPEPVEPAAADAPIVSTAPFGGWLLQDRVHHFRGLVVLEEANATAEERAAAAAAADGTAPPAARPSKLQPTSHFVSSLLVYAPAHAGSSFRDLVVASDRAPLVRLLRDACALLEQQHHLQDFHLKVVERAIEYDAKATAPQAADAAADETGVAAARAFVASPSNFYLRIAFGGVRDPVPVRPVCMSCAVDDENFNGTLLEKHTHDNVWLDVQARPVVVVTPVQHVERLTTLSDEQLAALFRDAYTVLDEAHAHAKEALSNGGAASPASLPPSFAFDHLTVNHGTYRNFIHTHLKAHVPPAVWAAIAPPATVGGDAAPAERLRNVTVHAPPFLAHKYPRQLAAVERMRHDRAHKRPAPSPPIEHSGDLVEAQEEVIAHEGGQPPVQPQPQPQQPQQQPPQPWDPYAQQQQHLAAAAAAAAYGGFVAPSPYGYPPLHPAQVQQMMLLMQQQPGLFAAAGPGVPHAALLAQQRHLLPQHLQQQQQHAMWMAQMMPPPPAPAATLGAPAPAAAAAPIDATGGSTPRSDASTPAPSTTSASPMLAANAASAGSSAPPLLQMPATAASASSGLLPIPAVAGVPAGAAATPPQRAAGPMWSQMNPQALQQMQMMGLSPFGAPMGWMLDPYALQQQQQHAMLNSMAGVGPYAFPGVQHGAAGAMFGAMPNGAPGGYPSPLPPPLGHGHAHPHMLAQQHQGHLPHAAFVQDGAHGHHPNQQQQQSGGGKGKRKKQQQQQQQQQQMLMQQQMQQQLQQQQQQFSQQQLQQPAAPAPAAALAPATDA